MNDLWMLTVTLLSNNIQAYQRLSSREDFDSASVVCFQCSDLSQDESSQDEKLGPCPGWLRPPVVYPASSVYDGCISILDSEGRIKVQGGIVHSLCQKYENMTDYVENLIGTPGKVICCKGPDCMPEYFRKAENSGVGYMYDLNIEEGSPIVQKLQADPPYFCNSARVGRRHYNLLISLFSFFAVYYQ
eukprot:TRINITY_DN35827_c0_g1_i2.p1 TRINITY_DN35827_c0_g1~~TRINITY_DN35827_c0_g1_i2.p1  ORF type:complete len:200 (-),score=13.95 TRINITY_DN35827_c0_g1_i2:17-580(-)